MARCLRSPAVLMTIYVVLVWWDGPWLGTDNGAHRNGVQIIIAVVLAALAAKGSRAARVLMITYSIVGVAAVFFGGTHSGVSKPLGSFLLAMACVLAQIGLLVSSPMYQRTRPGWSRGQVHGDPFLPWPKLLPVLAGAAGGLVLALVPFSDGLRETVCMAGGGRPASPCWPAGYGYPIAYRYSWDNLAPRGTDLAVFATDWVLWTVSLLLVVYLVQLNRSREYAQLPTAEPVPGHP